MLTLFRKTTAVAIQRESEDSRSALRKELKEASAMQGPPEILPVENLGAYSGGAGPEAMRLLHGHLARVE
eukprot:7986987-Heterocapsa_arctica.AAC.1